MGDMRPVASVQKAQANYTELTQWWDKFTEHYVECGECSVCEQFKQFLDTHEIIDVRLKSS